MKKMLRKRPQSSPDADRLVAGGRGPATLEGVTAEIVEAHFAPPAAGDLTFLD